MGTADSGCLVFVCDGFFIAVTGHSGTDLLVGAAFFRVRVRVGNAVGGALGRGTDHLEVATVIVIGPAVEVYPVLRARLADDRELRATASHTYNSQDFSVQAGPPGAARPRGARRQQYSEKFERGDAQSRTHRQQRSLHWSLQGASNLRTLLNLAAGSHHPFIRELHVDADAQVTPVVVATAACIVLEPRANGLARPPNSRARAERGVLYAHMLESQMLLL